MQLIISQTLKAKRRLKKAAKAARKNNRRATLETEADTLGGTRCSTTMKWYSTDSLHTNAQRSPVAVQVRFSNIFSYPFSDFRFRYMSTAMKNLKNFAKTQLDEVVLDRFLAHQCTTKPSEIFCHYFNFQIIS